MNRLFKLEGREYQVPDPARRRCSRVPSYSMTRITSDDVVSWSMTVGTEAHERFLLARSIKSKHMG